MHNCATLEVNGAIAPWVLSRAVYVCNIKITRSMVIHDWRADFNPMMREATKVQIEAQAVLDGSKVATMFASCRRLKSLGVKGCQIDAEALHMVMQLCPQLQEVDLSLTNAQSSNITPMLSPRIVALDLTACRSIDDEAMASIVRACTGLTTLIPDGWTHCTHVSLNAIATHCPQLHVLDLKLWVDQPDNSMMVLATGCRQLRSLHFEVCKTLSPLRAQEIVANHTRLQIIWEVMFLVLTALLLLE